MALLASDRQDDLLRWGAILRGFGPETFVALCGGGPDELRALAAEGALHEAGAADGPYTLAPEARRAALAAMRAERPRTELALHARAFTYYALQFGPADDTDAASTAEDEALYHLDCLHDLFVEYMEWESIISYTSALRNRGPWGPRVERRLELYEAHIDVRAGRVAEGLARIERLLAAPDLEPALRLRALHIGHVAHIYESRYDRAMAMLREARRLARTLGDQARRSYVLLSIGQIYNDLADHRRALALSKLSLRLARESGAFYREIHACYEVGSNAMQLGLWDEALAALDEAERAYRALGLERRLAMILWAKGLIYQISGDQQRCAATFEQALESARLDQSHNVLAASDILAQLGLLAQTQGDDVRALDHYREASDLARQYGIRHWLPILQARMAGALARLGRDEEAAALWREAVAAVESLRSAIDVETIRVSLFGTTQYIYESFVIFLLERGQPAEAFAYVERARSRAFLDLLQSAGPAAQADDAPTTLAELGPATLAELQGRLGEGEVVLEYFTTGVRPRGEHWINRIPEPHRRLREAVLPRPMTVLFIVTRDMVRVKRIRDLAGGSRASRQVIDLDPNKLQPSGSSDDPVLDILRLEARISWLSKRLLAPASAWIRHRRHITIIPHGPLHYVPFLALRRPDGSHLLTEGGPSVSLAPSAAALLHALRERPAGHAAGGIAIGYNGRGRDRLDHAEDEAAAIARRFGGEAWVGSATKSAALLGQPRQVRWLHIAGHSRYDRSRAHTGALLVGEGDELTATGLLQRRGRPLRAELVTLSSCMSGFSSVAAGDELFGLQRAFLATVAPTVICTLARARDRVALLVMDQLYARLDDAGPAVALRDALLAVRAMTRAEIEQTLERYGYPSLPPGGQPTDVPFARPEYWAPFVLIGRP